MVKNPAIPFYEIRVRGLLEGSLLHAFPALSANWQGTETVLCGELPDQAALYGVLTQIESLGLELVAVQQVTASYGAAARTVVGYVGHRPAGRPAGRQCRRWPARSAQ